MIDIQKRSPIFPFSFLVVTFFSYSTSRSFVRSLDRVSHHINSQRWVESTINHEIRRTTPKAQRNADALVGEMNWPYVSTTFCVPLSSPTTGLLKHNEKRQTICLPIFYSVLNIFEYMHTENRQEEDNDDEKKNFCYWRGLRRKRRKSGCFY